MEESKVNVLLENILSTEMIEDRSRDYQAIIECPFCNSRKLIGKSAIDITHKSDCIYGMAMHIRTSNSLKD